MKVVLFLDSSGFGGIETHVLQLAKMLRHRQVAVEVLFYQYYGDHPLRDLLDRREISYRCCDGKLSRLRQILGALSAEDTVHAHGYKASILARLLLRGGHSAQCVTTFHAGETGSVRLQLYEAINRFTARWSRNIAVSDSICHRVGHGCVVVNNFVDISHRPARSDRLIEAPMRIGFVGRLSKEKGFDRFISLAEQLPEYTWLVFGDGPMRDKVKNNAHVTWYGSVPSMTDHWQKMDVLIMPSRQEGLPMAAIEALGSGTLVAATRVGQLPELLPRQCLVLESEWKMLPAVLDLMSSWSLAEWLDQQLIAERKIVQQYSADALWPTYSLIYRVDDILTLAEA